MAQRGHGKFASGTVATTILFAAFATPAEPLATSPAGRRAADSALSGGPDGRGWGGALAEDCTIGVSAEHPNQFGFRVTVRQWVRGATVRWHFDNPIYLTKHWGPVKVLPRADGDAANRTTMILSFVLKGSGPKERPIARGGRRSDQWGFVLVEPYTGHWSVTCVLPRPPPSPPGLHATDLFTPESRVHVRTHTTLRGHQGGNRTDLVVSDVQAPTLGGAMSRLARSVAAAFLHPFSSNMTTTKAVDSRMTSQRAKAGGRARRRRGRAKGKGKSRGRWRRAKGKSKGDRQTRR